MPGSSLRERIDALQQRHVALAFPFAVHKRFTEDRGKHFAALISYYGFFSLFPLLLAFVSLLGVVLFSAFAVGCDTVEGIGEDVEDLGDEIEDAADDARN